MYPVVVFSDDMIQRKRRRRLAKEEKLNWKLRLFNAVKSKCASSVESVISAGVNINEPHPHDGKTPLHLAVYLDLTDIVKMLIEKGADVNIPDGKCITPLICAIMRENSEIITLLLNADADLLKSDKNGNSALHYAARFNGSSVALLLSLGIDVDIPDKDSITPLMYAIKADNIENVEQLLNEGARLLITDNNDETALHYAARYSKRSISLLLSKDVNIDVIVQYRNLRKSKSPLMAAADAGNLSTIELLLIKGAYVNLRSGDMRTALHFANSGGVVDILCEWGADIHAWNIDGKTALHLAVDEDKFDVMEALMCFGPPPSDFGSFVSGQVMDLLSDALDSNTQTVCHILVKFKLVYPTLNLLDSYDSEYLEKCILEVNRMKDTSFGKIRPFRILVRGLNDCMFAENEELCAYFECEQFTQDFPIYHSILRRRLRIAKRRFSLVTNSIALFTTRVENRHLNLPNEVCHEIFSYLSIADLINLNRALDCRFVLHRYQM